jgi:hypothetical protein
VELAPAVRRAVGLHAQLGCDDARRVAVLRPDDRRDTAAGVLNPGDDNDRFGTEHVRDSGITVLDYRDLRAGTIPAAS